MKPVKKTTYLRILIVVIFYQLTVIPVNWHYALKQLLDTVNYITTSFALYLIKGIRLMIWRFFLIIYYSKIGSPKP
jgi:hypothetical protein